MLGSGSRRRAAACGTAASRAPRSQTGGPGSPPARSGRESRRFRAPSRPARAAVRFSFELSRLFRARSGPKYGARRVDFHGEHEGVIAFGAFDLYRLDSNASEAARRSLGHRGRLSDREARAEPPVPEGSRTTADPRRTAPLAEGAVAKARPVGTEESVCRRRQPSEAAKRLGVSRSRFTTWLACPGLSPTRTVRVWNCEPAGAQRAPLRSSL